MHSAIQRSISDQLVSSHAVTHMLGLLPFRLTADSQLADIHLAHLFAIGVATGFLGGTTQSRLAGRRLHQGSWTLEKL